MEVVPEEVQTGYQEAFPYREGDQTLEQGSLRGYQCPKPGSVRESLGQALKNLLYCWVSPEVLIIFYQMSQK